MSRGCGKRERGDSRREGDLGNRKIAYPPRDSSNRTIFNVDLDLSCRDPVMDGVPVNFLSDEGEGFKIGEEDVGRRKCISA